MAGRKSALNTTVVYSTDRSTGPGVSVTLCCLVFFFSTRRFFLCLALWYFVLVIFSPFSIAITSLGEQRVSLGAFRTLRLFDLHLFGFVYSLFLLVSGKDCGL